jgi:hypothetical protein
MHADDKRDHRGHRSINAGIGLKAPTPAPATQGELPPGRAGARLEPHRRGPGIITAAPSGSRATRCTAARRRSCPPSGHPLLTREEPRVINLNALPPGRGPCQPAGGPRRPDRPPRQARHPAPGRRDADDGDRDRDVQPAGLDQRSPGQGHAHRGGQRAQGPAPRPAAPAASRARSASASAPRAWSSRHSARAATSTQASSSTPRCCA